MPAAHRPPTGTGSAINATLFATARLARRVAEDGELPALFGEQNQRGVPTRSVLLFGVAATALAAVGTLGDLVEAASLTFLLTFAGVNTLAAASTPGSRVLPALGALGAAGAATLAGWRLGTRNPTSVALLGALILAAVILRPLILHRRSHRHGAASGRRSHECGDR